MADNFDTYAWNRNRLIESTLSDADLKAKQNVDIIYSQIIQDFPNKFESPIEKSQLKYSIASAFTELSLMKEEEGKTYTIQYWVYRDDDWDDTEVEVTATSEADALKKAKEENRGKDFKIV